MPRAKLIADLLVIATSQTDFCNSLQSLFQTIDEINLQAVKRATKVWTGVTEAPFLLCRDSYSEFQTYAPSSELEIGN